MPANTFIRLGFTFDYFVPGVLLIIIGGVCFFANSFIAFFILIFGITLLLLRSGIEIDPDKKRVRKFYDFFSVRFGMWIYSMNFSKVELSPTNESQTMLGRSGEMTYETKTYDILFIDDSGSSKELNDFKSYDTAVHVLDQISLILKLESINEVAEIRSAAMKRRKDKHYRK